MLKVTLNHWGFFPLSSCAEQKSIIHTVAARLIGYLWVTRTSNVLTLGLQDTFCNF